MIEHLDLSGVWTFVPRRLCDDRGWFCESFNARTLGDGLGGAVFVQENHVCSKSSGTLRGLHFQIPPRAQDKLVRVLQGAVLDVAVDLRRHSVHYGKWASALLSAENGRQMFIPKGFAHGYVALKPDTEVLYKVSDYYSPEHERGLIWNDPNVGIDWTLAPEDMLMRERDRTLPRLVDLPQFF